MMTKHLRIGWGRKLPIVQRIINSSIHDSIGVSPSQLLFGNAIQLDKRLYLPVTALNVGERQLSDWADKQLREQSDLLEKARKRQIIAC